MNQDAAYQFIRLGRNLERADMSTRIIDAASAGLMGRSEEISPYQNVLWISVLQSLSAYQMYRLNVQRNVSPGDVLEFLFQSRVFPRAVAHCLGEMERSMQVLPEPKPALAAVRRVARKLQQADLGALAEGGLHGFIDELQIELEAVHYATVNTWFSPGQAQ